jgi:hypothetical protein
MLQVGDDSVTKVWVRVFGGHPKIDFCKFRLPQVICFNMHAKEDVELGRLRLTTSRAEVVCTCFPLMQFYARGEPSGQPFG